MRILLVHPAFPYKGKDLFPIGLGYLARIAQEKAEVFVIDEGVEKFDIKKVENIDPDIVGISSTTPSFPRAVEILKEIKKIGIKVIMGGTHVTFAPEEALREGADVVVRGEGELTFLDLLDGKSLSKIKGISYKKGRFFHNPDRELIENLDSIPFPAHKAFNIDKYKIMSIITSRGCPYSCSYCSASVFWRHRVRFRSPENVIEELKMISALGFRLIRFMDSTFTLDEKRALKICEKIKKEDLDIKWSCETRADHLSDTLLKGLKKAGCDLICIGIDSASQVILNMNKRKISVKEMKKTFEKIKAHDIRTRAYVTFGLPGETEKSVVKTLRFLKEIKPDQILLSLATSYPGTELWMKNYVSVHPSWVAKFHGHGRGGKLHLPEGMSRREYIKLADLMYHEIKTMASYRGR